MRHQTRFTSLPRNPSSHRRHRSTSSNSSTLNTQNRINPRSTQPPRSHRHNARRRTRSITIKTRMHTTQINRFKMTITSNRSTRPRNQNSHASRDNSRRHTPATPARRSRRSHKPSRMRLLLSHRKPRILRRNKTASRLRMQLINSSMPPIHSMRRQHRTVNACNQDNITMSRHNYYNRSHRRRRRHKRRSANPSSMRLLRIRTTPAIRLLRSRHNSRRPQRRRRSISTRRTTKRPIRIYIVRRSTRSNRHPRTIRTQ